MSELLKALNEVPPNFERAEEILLGDQYKKAPMDLNQPHRPNNYGNAPIHLAAVYQNLSVMQLLIDHGANPRLKNDWGADALSIFLIKNFVEGVEFLINNKVDLCEELADYAQRHQGSNVFHVAIINGHVDMMEYLMKNKVPGLDQLDSGGDSSLCLACAVDQDIVRLIVDAGMDVNQPSNQRVPLMIALEHNKEDIVRLLLSRDADVNVVIKGNTVLDFAEPGSVCETLINIEIERLALEAAAITTASNRHKEGLERSHKDKRWL